MENQVKEFRMEGPNLIIDVSNNDKLTIPTKEGPKEIGVFEQRTIQKIDPDKIHVLHDFIKEQKQQGETQLAAIEKQLEPLKDTHELDPKVMEHCKKAIGKGTKAFKTQMNALNEAIIDLDRKKKLTAQKEFLSKQMLLVNADLDKFEAAIK